ncbi:MAG: c-type cytochrome [Gammaproteobacteria bacterium]
MFRFSITVLFFIAATGTAGAVGEPRLEVDEAAPAYAVECPEGAADAGVCAVDETVYSGWRTYSIACQQCHGGGGVGTTIGPNLLSRLNDEGVDFGRFLYVMEHGYTGQMGVMPSLAKNPRVQQNKAAIYTYLKARADGALPNGRPPKP